MLVGWGIPYFTYSPHDDGIVKCNYWTNINQFEELLLCLSGRWRRGLISEVTMMGVN